MSDDRRGDISSETVRAVLDALREKAPSEMPTPRSYESGEQFERRMRRSADRDFYEFPAHIRKWFDSLDEEKIEAINRVVKLRAEGQTWMAGKSEDHWKALDQMVKDYDGARLIGRFLWKAIAALGFIFGGFWAFGKQIGELLSYFHIGRLP